MSRRGTVHCGICQSRFGDSDCFEQRGDGTTDDPFYFVPRLDDDAANLLECSRNGLSAPLPPVYSDPPAVHAYSSVSQPIPFDTLQVLFFNEERYDTDNMHDRVQNSSRLTFNTSGIYSVVLNIRWDRFIIDITGDVAGYIRRNGVETLAFESDAYGHVGLFNWMSIKAVAAFEAGEYVEAMAQQDALVAGALVTDDDTAYMNSISSEYQVPNFAAMYLRPLP